MLFMSFIVHSYAFHNVLSRLLLFANGLLVSFTQVNFVNKCIDEAPHGSTLHDLDHISDPSDQIQLIWIVWMDYFMLNRRQNLCERDISRLHEAAKSLLDNLNTHLPERTGSAAADGEPAGWNFWKAHSILHASLDRLLFGWSEITSTQGAERAHKVSKSASSSLFIRFSYSIHVLNSIYHILFIYYSYTIHTRCLKDFLISSTNISGHREVLGKEYQQQDNI